MADYPCDGECGRLANLSVTNFENGEVQFLEPECAGLLFTTLLGTINPEALATVLEPLGFVAKPAPKGRKAKEPIEADESNRTIAEIIETGPRPIEDTPAPEPENVPQ